MQRVSVIVNIDEAGRIRFPVDFLPGHYSLELIKYESDQPNRLVPQYIPFPIVQDIHTALKILAGVCDGARTQDDQGFDGADTGFGRSLAAQNFLSQKQARCAIRMVVKYHRQLPDDLVERVRQYA